MEDSDKSHAEVKLDNIHCSPLTDPSSHAIVEDCQIGQAWFSLGESMLTVPNYLLFFHMKVCSSWQKAMWRVSLNGIATN